MSLCKSSLFPPPQSQIFSQSGCPSSRARIHPERTASFDRSLPWCPPMDSGAHSWKSTWCHTSPACPLKLQLALSVKILFILNLHIPSFIAHTLFWLLQLLISHPNSTPLNGFHFTWSWHLCSTHVFSYFLSLDLDTWQKARVCLFFWHQKTL